MENLVYKHFDISEKKCLFVFDNILKYFNLKKLNQKYVKQREAMIISNQAMG